LEIKGLKESLGVTDEQFENLATLKVATQMQTALLYMNIMNRGGNIHSVDHVATAKRRKANKVARKQRKINRGK